MKFAPKIAIKMTAICAITVMYSQATIAMAQGKTMCLPRGQAEQAALSVFPGLVKGARNTCTQHIPQGSGLNISDAQINAHYGAAADQAWQNGGSQAIKMLLGRDLPSYIDVSTLRPLADQFVSAAVVQKMDISDCVRVNCFYENLSPLPPQNIASMAVMLFEQWRSEAKAKGNVNNAQSGGNVSPLSLDICRDALSPK